MTKIRIMKKIIKSLPTFRILNGLVQVNQGDDFVCFTKNDINALRMLTEGKFDTNVYTTRVNHVRLQFLNDGTFLATCEGNAVCITPKAFRLLQKFKKQNSQKILWDMDFRKHKRY